MKLQKLEDVGGVVSTQHSSDTMILPTYQSSCEFHFNGRLIMRMDAENAWFRENVTYGEETFVFSSSMAQPGGGFTLFWFHGFQLSKGS